jgi:hypothetical protein
MQDVIRGIENEIIKLPPPMEDSEFRKIGINWACHSLRHYDGDLLKRALAISISISDFCNEIEQAR